MIKRLCNHAGCHNLVPFNQRYCKKHQLAVRHRDADSDRYSYRKANGGRYFTFYKGRQWQKLSYSYRLRYPLCKWCQAKGLYVQADVVDHVVPIRIDWSRRFDESNLQSLCDSCHWIKSQEDKEKYNLRRLGTPPD